MSRSGSTKKKPKKVDVDDLSDQQKVFVTSYAGSWNGAEAARIAKYAHPGVAAAKLLKNPIIQKAIAWEKQQLLAKIGINAAEILFHLWCMSTVTGDDFTDETGKIITDMNELSLRAKACIQGLEQTITTYTTEDGTTTEEVKTKLKITDKVRSVDMAMKHKGLFDEMIQQMFGGSGKPQMDWSALYGRPKDATAPDIIEVKRVESKPMEIKK